MSEHSTLTRTTVRDRLLRARFTANRSTPIMTLAAAKIYLNTAASDEDTLITDMIEGATNEVENKTHRTLITRAVETVWAATALPRTAGIRCRNRESTV